MCITSTKEENLKKNAESGEVKQKHCRVIGKQKKQGSSPKNTERTVNTGAAEDKQPSRADQTFGSVLSSRASDVEW